MIRSFTLAPEDVAKARRLYDDDALIADICQQLCVSEGWFYAFRRANGWPARQPFGPRKQKVASGPPRARKTDRRARYIARLDAALGREITRVEQAQQNAAPGTPGANARTLTSLVKTLAELKRLGCEAAKDKHDAADATDRPPRELAELRAELARRIERFQNEEETE